MTRGERNERFYAGIYRRAIALVAAPIMFPIIVYTTFLDSETSVPFLTALKDAIKSNWKMFCAFMRDPLT